MGRAVWKPAPDFRTSATAWLTAGAAHHTVMTTQLGIEVIRDFATMSSVELLEIDGIYPAPYVARIYWVAAERWSVFRTSEWEEQLRSAHKLTFAKLPPKVRMALTLPAAKQKRLIAERRKLLAAKRG